VFSQFGTLSDKLSRQKHQNLQSQKGLESMIRCPMIKASYRGGESDRVEDKRGSIDKHKEQSYNRDKAALTWTLKSTQRARITAAVRSLVTATTIDYAARSVTYEIKDVEIGAVSLVLAFSPSSDASSKWVRETSKIKSPLFKLSTSIVPSPRPKMSAKKSPFNLQTCARPNILQLQPYRCARE
jgi:hypothetical protein